MVTLAEAHRARMFSTILCSPRLDHRAADSPFLLVSTSGKRRERHRPRIGVYPRRHSSLMRSSPPCRSSASPRKGRYPQSGATCSSRLGGLLSLHLTKSCTSLYG